MSKLAAYLAKNYLSASNEATSKSKDYDIDDRPKKKRKKDRSHKDSQGGGLVIADDDEDLKTLSRRREEEDDEDGRPVYDSNVKSAEFRRKKQSGWKSVDAGGSDGPLTKPGGNANDGNPTAEGEEEADKILRAAADLAEQRRRDVEDEDQPTVVNNMDSEIGSTDIKMSSGVRAGLQTAADTAKMIEEEERKQAEEKEQERQRRKRSKSSKSKDDQEDQPEETIYRDATGRRIDISLRRAEIRAQELAKLAAEKKAKEEAMGDVQRKEKEQKKQDLEEAKFLTLGRGADDEEMNQRLKEEIRADDPMAAYMLSRRNDGDDMDVDGDGDRKERHGNAVSTAVTKQQRVKTYTGHAPPNRYGIQPGWRWDGVDRGNGFEKQWFQARSRKSRNAQMEYEWQMDE